MVPRCSERFGETVAAPDRVWVVDSVAGLYPIFTAPLTRSLFSKATLYLCAAWGHSTRTTGLPGWILLFVSQGELAAAEVAAEAGRRDRYR
jgi:hypothetical protein